MNKYDISGLLRTYSEQVLSAKNTAQLRYIVAQLKADLDLRKIYQPSDEDNTP